jgi:peptidylprolyl isomerase
MTNVRHIIRAAIGTIFLFSYVYAFGNEILRLEVDGSSSGTVDIQLFTKIAPIHSKRIKKLVTESKYDGVVFHRVIAGFMAQSGDVKFGNIDNLQIDLVGMGGSQYPNLTAEFSNQPFEKGTVGMARSRDPNSANSQFFIMFADAPHLNGKYTVIGKVISGMETVMEIKKGDIKQNGAVSQPDYIKNASIIEK